MDRNQELREKVLSYVKDVYEKEERTPTIREISEKIEGITRSNIYRLFKGIGQICEEAGIEIPNSRMKLTKKASSARKRKVESGFPDITLSGKLAQDLLVFSTLENRTPQDLMEEFLKQYRLFKTRFGLSSIMLGNFARFITECERRGLGIDQIKNSMLKFVGMGLDGLSPNRFDVLMKVRNFMIVNKFNTGHLLELFALQKDLYIRGYDLCMDYAQNEVMIILTEKEKMRPAVIASIGGNLKTALAFKRPTRILRV